MIDGCLFWISNRFLFIKKKNLSFWVDFFMVCVYNKGE